MAQDGRSNGERPVDTQDWFRRLCKAQRGRIAHRFERMDRRLKQARVEAMEDWDSAGSRSGKKPGLDYYDAREW